MNMKKKIIVACNIVYVLGVLNASAQDTTAFNKQVDFSKKSATSRIPSSIR